LASQITAPTNVEATDQLGPVIDVAFVLESDLSTDAKESGNDNIIKTEKICLKFTTVTSGVVDFNIWSLQFGNNNAFDGDTTTIPVYADGCPSADSIGAFEDRQAFPNAGTACDGNTVKNCEKQRAVCFWPFAFTDTKDVYVKASVKVDTTSTVGAVADYTPAASTCSGGKRRRSINENDRTINDGEEMSLEAYYSFAKGVQQLANQIEDAACDNTSVVITIVVLSAVLILSIILNSFMVFTKMRSGKAGANA